jgi:DNA polymerase-3 subunit beta
VKTQVNRNDLASIINWVVGNLPTRPPLPVLAGVRITTADGKLNASGFDYNTSTNASIDANVTEPGEILVSGGLLAAIIKSLPAKAAVGLTTSDTNLSIIAGAARFTLPLMPIQDYPPLPQLPEPFGTIDGADLAAAVSQTAVCSGRDDTLPMLTGVHVVFGATGITMAATDRFRLAVCDTPFTPIVDSAEFPTALIPANTLASAARAFNTGTVTVRLGDGIIGLSSEGKDITMRLLDVEFVKYRSLIPVEHVTVVDVDSKELLAAVKRASLVTDRGHHLHLNITGSKLVLTAGDDYTASTSETIPATQDGPDLLIAFNPTYMVDAINSAGGARTRMSFTKASRPGVFGDPDTIDGYVHLVMPARLPG